MRQHSRCDRAGSRRRREMPWRGKRHAVTFPCALSAQIVYARRRHRIAEVNHASDATRGAARKCIGRRGSARPVRRRDSSTGGDTSPRDALRGKRHAVAFPCALSASELFVRAGEPRLRRPGAAVQQTMKAARQRQWTKRGADHLREDQAWSERHGSEEQMLATRFAAPTFPCLRNRCFRPTRAWLSGSNRVWTSAKYEAEPLPRRRAWFTEASRCRRLADRRCALSAKRSPLAFRWRRNGSAPRLALCAGLKALRYRCEKRSLCPTT